MNKDHVYTRVLSFLVSKHLSVKHLISGYGAQMCYSMMSK